MFKSHLGFSYADLLDSLDQLSDLAASFFSSIPNRGQVPLPSIPDHPFGPDERGVRPTLRCVSVTRYSCFDDRPLSLFKQLWTSMLWKYPFH